MIKMDLVKIEAVIFDLDGLLLDTEPIYRMAWQKAAKELGYTISDDLYLSLIGRRIKDAETILTEIFRDDLPMSEFHTLWTQLWHDHVKDNGIAEKSGARELLDFLEKRTIAKAVATSTNWNEAMLSLGEMKERFNAIVTGDQIKNGKPSPDIFIEASRLLRISPENCLVLEDSEAGIKAAHSAGMTSIVVPDLIQPSEEVASIVYRIYYSLHDVKKLLKRSLVSK
ncbi:MAG: HAD family phosphatase [Planctomycetes bacterium]|nr:HAD family phosphatase [Planctomycetota bacterium]